MTSVRDLLEPATRMHLKTDEAVPVSVAISLKRIADALEGSSPISLRLEIGDIRQTFVAKTPAEIKEMFQNWREAL